MKLKYIIGIDPGRNGGLAAIDVESRELHSVFAFPMVGTKPDYEATKESILDLIEPHNSIVYIEEVHAIFGASAKSTFEFGYHAGYLYGVLKAKGCRIEFVQPKIWQKKVWATQDKVLKASNRVDPKPTSVLAAKRLFPGQDLRKSTQAKKPHEGIVDAALIAYYGVKNQNL